LGPIWLGNPSNIWVIEAFEEVIVMVSLIMVVPQLLVEICRFTFTVQVFVSQPAPFWALTLSWRRAPI